MPSVVVCPKCETRYQVPEKALGKTLQCKKCGQSFPAKVAEAVAAGSSSASTAPPNRQPPGPEISAEVYKRLGLDGPFKRPPEVLADVPSPPPRDILGNLAAEPGFGTEEVRSGGNPVSKSKATDELQDVVVNPFAKAAAKNIKRRPEDLRANGYAFRSLGSLAKIISILHWMLLALVVIGIAALAGIFYFSDWRNLEEGTPPPGFLLMIIGYVVGGLMMLAAIILLFIFMYRANANLWAMSTKDLKYTPAWTVIAWIIPFASLVLPVMAMSEIYKASHSPGGSKWKSAPAPGVVVGWWVCLLFGMTVPIALILLPKVVTTISKKQDRYAGVGG